jgi:hypothetical protein
VRDREHVCGVYLLFGGKLIARLYYFFKQILCFDLTAEILPADLDAMTPAMPPPPQNFLDNDDKLS